MRAKCMCITVVVGFSVCCLAVAIKLGDRQSFMEATIYLNNTEILDCFETTDMRDSLLFYLAGNMQWKVSLERGALVAQKYPVDECGIRRERNHVHKQGQTRIRLRLGPSKYGVSPDFESMTFVLSGSKAAKIKLYKERSGGYSSHCLLGNTHRTMWLDVMEIGESLTRELTARTISEVLSELERLRETLEQKGRQGLSDILPRGSTINSKKEVSLEMTPGLQNGLYTIRGYLNIGKPGHVTIRLFDVETAQEICPRISELRYREYIGWSPNEQERFGFQSSITIPREAQASAEGKRRVKVALHFQPSEYPVYEQVEELTTWVR